MRKHRESIDLDKVKHGAPIPMGSRVGNMIFSSGIMGQDPATGELPADPRLQARFCFENLKAMLEKAGSKLGDVGHVTVFIKDNSMRPHVNEFWAIHFPDPHDRPARHAVVSDLQGGMLVQLEIIAVIESA